MTEKMEELIFEQLFKINEELKSCVKKDDLKNFATKDDLKNFATKEDLKNFATKEDLKAMEQRLDKKIDAKFAEQAIEISEEFRMAFESADRIHSKMLAGDNKRNNKKISQVV